MYYAQVQARDYTQITGVGRGLKFMFQLINKQGPPQRYSVFLWTLPFKRKTAANSKMINQSFISQLMKSAQI